MVFIVLRNMVCTIFVLRHVIFPTHITLDQSLSTNKDKPISSVVAATVNHICFLTRHFIKVNMTGFLTLVFCFILGLSLCKISVLLGKHLFIGPFDVLPLALKNNKFQVLVIHVYLQMMCHNIQCHSGFC